MKKNRISKYLDTYKYGGITDLINRILAKLKINFKFKTQIERKKEYFLSKVIKLSNSQVMAGPYKGTEFVVKSYWGSYDMSSKLLGSYERHIQEKIVEIKNKNNLEIIINIGAGEGYHIVSLIKNNFFADGIAFESETESQNLLKDNLKLNNIENKVKIYGEANFDLIKKLNVQNVNKTLFLIDIEGEEFNLLNNSFLELFKTSYFVIEMHEFILKDKQKVKNFYELIEKNFHTHLIKNNCVNLYEIKELNLVSDNVRMLGLSENRPSKMNWLFLEPK